MNCAHRGSVETAAPADTGCSLPSCILAHLLYTLSPHRRRASRQPLWALPNLVCACICGGTGRQTRALSAMPSAQSRWDVFRSERHAERSEPLGRVTLVLDRRASAAAPPAAHAAPAALAAALTGLLAIVVRRRRRRRWIAHDGARAAAGWRRPRRRLQRRRGGGGGGGRRGGRRGGRAELGADCSHGGWQRGSIPRPLVLAALALPFSTLPSREEGSGARCLSGGRDHY